ncbi:hypothetical protein [Actinomadura rugatobispora]|uniref:FXSXX-COOH protein n=1 Tax=Actinomadura rugatobispora TaxID=1994 RepID=A0ABW1A2Y1_9ACTN|nr:hypothetical protein GCM10010200_018870 [Actinomadura rugatobispora]
MSDAEDFGGVLLDFSEVSLDDVAAVDAAVVERELRSLLTSDHGDDAVARFDAVVDDV